MFEGRNGRPWGWRVLVVVAAVMALGSATDAVWRVFQGEWWALLSLVPWLLFCYWIGAGAWRRATEPDPSN